MSSKNQKDLEDAAAAADVAAGDAIAKYMKATRRSKDAQELKEQNPNNQTFHKEAFQLTLQVMDAREVMDKAIDASAVAREAAGPVEDRLREQKPSVVAAKQGIIDAIKEANFTSPSSSTDLADTKPEVEQEKSNRGPQT